MAISSFPVAPVRSDSTTFRPRAEAWVAHMPTFTAEANALAVEVQGHADDVAADKLLCDAAVSDAEAAQAAAESASSATAWVSGTTYAIGNVRYSRIDFLSYRRTTAGGGTTDPKLDAINWTCLNVISSPNVQTFMTSGTWTKPSNRLGSTRALLQAWGAGGSGGRHASGLPGGGGGGGYGERWIFLSDLPATITITVGAGGLPKGADGNGNSGGTTTIGTFLSVYGGGYGSGSPLFNGGGGGGPLSAGAGHLPGSPMLALYAQNNSGAWIFSVLGQGGLSTDVTAGRDGDATHGGGGGTSYTNGGASINSGGGGAAGYSGATGGLSIAGGGGGNAGAAGATPGGGGGGAVGSGSSGAGGAGKVIITVF
jgi:hypothetical protein